MGHSQAEKAQSKQRILDAAAVQIRELGLAGVSIAELMKSAKLTHGAFYGHFESRDDLIAEALEKALNDGQASAVRTARSKGTRTLKSFLNSYLSKIHRDNPGSSCAVSALAGEAARSDARVRAVVTAQIEKYFSNIRAIVNDENANDFAMATMSMVIGAITLARVTRDEEASEKILLAARKMVLEYAESKGLS